MNNVKNIECIHSVCDLDGTCRVCGGNALIDKGIITMKKYKVEFVQTETFIVDVLAKDEAEAIELAETKWNKLNEAGIIHYNLSDTRLEQTMVYNVTNTDDPFNP